MVFINFKMRMKIESLFIEWCEKNGIAKEPNSMVAFMIEEGWLNEEKISKDLRNKALEYYEDKRQDCDTCRHQDGIDGKCKTCGSNWEAKGEPQTDYKKWDAPPKVKLPKEITTCVSVLASALEDEPQTEREGE